MRLLNAAIGGAILLACALTLSAFPAKAQGPCASETITKAFGLDYIHKNPGVKATNVGEAELAQALYVEYQKFTKRPPDESLKAKIGSALVVSMTTLGYYAIVFYDAAECELGYTSQLNRQQIDEILKNWAGIAGEEA